MELAAAGGGGAGPRAAPQGPHFASAGESTAAEARKGLVALHGGPRGVWQIFVGEEPTVTSGVLLGAEAFWLFQRNSSRGWGGNRRGTFLFPSALWSWQTVPRMAYVTTPGADSSLCLCGDHRVSAAQEKCQRCSVWLGP